MITYVTAMIDVYNSCDTRPFEWRLDCFLELARTNIHICVYCSPLYHAKLIDATQGLERVKIMDPIDIDTVSVRRFTAGLDCRLPLDREQRKDSEMYMIVMNTKIELVCDAINKRPFGSDMYAWIDFSLTYVFNHTHTLERLGQISDADILTRTRLILPGCWDHFSEHHSDQAVWRFCGGFVLGHCDAFIELQGYYEKHFRTFVQTNSLAWEVNFWAWLEKTTEWKPIWYKADHNDTIITGIDALKN